MGVAPAGDAVSKKNTPGGIWKRLKQLVELPDPVQQTKQAPAESSPGLQQSTPGGGKQLWSKLRRLAGRKQRKGSPAAAQERMGATCVASSSKSLSSSQPLHSADQKTRDSSLTRVPVTGGRQADSPLVLKRQSKSQPNLMDSMALHDSEMTSQSQRRRSAQAPTKSAKRSFRVAAKDSMHSSSNQRYHSATSEAVMRKQRARSTSLVALMTGRKNGKTTGFAENEDSILSSRASVREMLDVWHAAQPACLQQSKQVFIDPDEYGGLTRYGEQPHWWPQDPLEKVNTLEDSFFDNIPTCIRRPKSSSGPVQDTPKLSRNGDPASMQQQLQQPQFKASMSFAQERLWVPRHVLFHRYLDEARALAAYEVSAAVVSEGPRGEGTDVAPMPSPELASGSSFLTSIAMSLVLEEVLNDSMAEKDVLRFMDSLNLDSSCIFVTATGRWTDEN